MDRVKRLIYCRICRGERNADSVCLGCGTPVANAEQKLAKRVKTMRKCPRCASSRYRDISGGQFSCLECHAMFEDPDFCFVDSRPEQNAMKKERRK